MLEAEVGGARRTVERLFLPYDLASSVPDGKVYAGEVFKPYRPVSETHEDARGRLYDLDTLGAVEPGVGANEVVFHGPRDTHWDSGSRLVFDPRSGTAALHGRREYQGPDVKEYRMPAVGVVHASHNEDYEEVEAYGSLGGALDDMGL